MCGRRRRRLSYHQNKTHLLVERSGLESERVDNVVDLLGTLGKGLLDLLSGRVTSCITC